MRLTPASVFARSYCLNEAKVKDALAPITKTVVIGPPSNCKPDQVQPKTANAAYSNQAYHNQAYSQLYRQGFDYRQQQPFIGNGWGYSYYNNGY